MSQTRHLHLFEGYGIEAEYMIVDRETLAARPVTDLLLKEIAGEIVNEVELGETAWSNELVMHVVEMKTNGPLADLSRLAGLFQADVTRINGILAKLGAKLMPTAMHPLFDPDREMKLWPHDNAEIYEAYNRIFDCRGHGWSNLQSVHINLPFYDDAEFGRLHAAVRLALPILPALAASSPIYGGKPSGLMDSRLEFYRHNQRAVPAITGGVIPEQAFSRREYEEMIFAKTYREIAPHDPDKILQEEWLNSRGAIARFDRNAIEIRVVDIQESPRMDAAVVTTIVSLVKALAEEVFAPLTALKSWSPEPLRPIFVDCLKGGGDAVIRDPDYLAVFGLKAANGVSAGQLWRHIVERLAKTSGNLLTGSGREVEVLTTQGCLAKRILGAVGPSPSEARIRDVFAGLCDVLADGGVFSGAR